MEAGKKRLAGDTTREATSDEVAELRKENQRLKEQVADLMLPMTHYGVTCFSITSILCFIANLCNSTFSVCLINSSYFFIPRSR